MATFINGESLSSVRTKINDAIDKVDGNAAFSNDISVTGNITVTGTVDGRDVAADGTKLDGVEASADVTDTANVTAAGALMDSELTSEASVKALDQGVATTDSPTFAGLTTTADVSFGDNDKAIFGAGSDLQIYHDGSNSFIDEAGTGNLRIRASSAVNIQTRNAGDTAWVNSFIADDGLGVRLFTNGSKKLETTSTGIDVTGNATFADNGKAIFGAGSDLQIYHDGSNSYIDDAGTGSLRIRAQDLLLADAAGNPFIAMLDLGTGGSVSLRHNTVEKLATTSTGIDVTGTVNLSGSVDFGDWTITESGGSLYFATGGTNKMKLDASGNLQVVGNVEANATIS